jgi:hypothetical protein
MAFEPMLFVDEVEGPLLHGSPAPYRLARSDRY